MGHIKNTANESLLRINYDLLEISTTRLSESTIPKSPPHPRATITHGNPTHITMPTYFAYDLIRSATLLTELAIDSSGEYQQGNEAPQDCIALSTGAIVTSFAAFEGFVNETITVHAKHNRRKGSLELFEDALFEQKILTRCKSLLIAFGVRVSWDIEPYQSLSMLYRVRNSIVHHEGDAGVSFSDGYHPKKVLRSLKTKIKSPYQDNPLNPYDWHVHALTPNGAVWSLNTVLAAISIIELELDAE